MTAASFYRQGLKGLPEGLTLAQWGPGEPSWHTWRGLWAGQHWLTLHERVEAGHAPPPDHLLWGEGLVRHAKHAADLLHQAVKNPVGRELAILAPRAWWAAVTDSMTYNRAHPVGRAIAVQDADLLQALLRHDPLRAVGLHAAWEQMVGHAARQCIDQGWRYGLDELACTGVDLTTVRDHQGHTLLHYAAREGKLGMARELVALGCSLHALDHHGRTPLGNVLEAKKRALGDGALRDPPLATADTPRLTVIQTLVELGAIPSQKQGVHGNKLSPLEQADRHQPVLAQAMRSVLAARALAVHLADLPVAAGQTGRTRL